jgi:hypothetical protein
LATVEEPWCGVSVAAKMCFLRWVSIAMNLASLYVSLLTARIVSADRRFVVGYNFGDV